MKRGEVVHDIVALDEEGFANAIDDLAAILVDAVRSGASVGFVEPFALDDARRWWRSLAADFNHGRFIVLVARTDGRVVGTAQLRLAQQPQRAARRRRREGARPTRYPAPRSWLRAHGPGR